MKLVGFLWDFVSSFLRSGILDTWACIMGNLTDCILYII